MNSNFDINYTTKLESLIELAEILNQQNDYEEVLRLVVEKTSNLINSDVALIIMINPRTQNTIKTVIKEDNYKIPKQYQFITATISGWVIDNNLPFLSVHLEGDDRFGKGLFFNIPFNSGICVLLKYEDIPLGTLLVLRNNDKEPFNKNDLDYLIKFGAVVSPFLSNKQKIQEYFNPSLSNSELLLKYEEIGLIGRSQKFIEMLKSIEAAAKCNVRVLLEGETGSGKEIIARAIHKLSERSKEKFVVVDCAAIPNNLIESELFGYVRGAYTGAISNRKGLIEEANSGTIFIDEINSLPFEVQGKLLRFIQENEIRPLGSNNPQKVEVRVIAATNTPLSKLVYQKQFREDLYYRLNVYPIHIPALEERQEDISYLANHFLKKFAQELNKSAEAFDNEITTFIHQKRWKGNVREQENFVERLLASSPDDEKILKAENFSKEIKDELQKIYHEPVRIVPNQSLKELLSMTEENLIRQALINCKWNQTKAAQSLMIPEQTLRYKMTKYGISKPI